MIDMSAYPDRCQFGFAPNQHNGLCNCTETGEYVTFLRALEAAVGADGLIHQADVRPRIQSIPHKHRGLLYRRAKAEGVLEFVRKEPSTDRAGGNSDKDSPVYRLRGAA